MRNEHETADVPIDTTADREPLIRRWLELVVQRSSLEELAARPMAERLRELDLLLEVVHSEGAARRDGLGAELDDALSAAFAAGHPFALALLAPPGDGPTASAWTVAAAETARREETVVAAHGGLTAIVIPAADGHSARVEADRIRVGAWQLLGGSCALPDVAVATHPADAADAPALAAAARERLPGGAPAGIPQPPHYDEEVRLRRTSPGGEPEEHAAPAGERPRRFAPASERERRSGPASERERRSGPDEQAPDRRGAWTDLGAGERLRDLWRELSADREPRDDDGPPADVTPLYPPPPE